MAQNRDKVGETGGGLRHVIAASARRGCLSTLIWVLIGVFVSYYYQDVAAGAAIILVATVVLLVIPTFKAVIALQPSAATPENERDPLLQELSDLSAPGEMPRRIADCRKRLAGVDRNDQPGLWAKLEVELGNSLEKNPQGGRAENLEQAIFHFEQALEIYTREGFPKKWAVTHDYLANAYSERIRGDRAQNLEEVISHYELALEVYTRRDFSVGWGVAQFSLAVAYWNRSRGERARNVEEAISHYEQALEVFTRRDYHAMWARTQSNLAVAYGDRIWGDEADNLEEVIERYELALEVRTRKDSPADWADTQYNLANAYAQRIRGDRAQNQEEAISRYELALEVYTREDSPVEWARIQINLANAYQDRIRGDRARNVDEAATRYEMALEVYTREDSPLRLRWATAQNNLANAYRDRTSGGKARNQEEAISRHKQALEVRTREDFPEYWAQTQHNLALACEDRIRGDKAENQEDAIARYKQALEVRTPSTLPQNCRDTAYVLGSLLYGKGRYDEARTALRTAHEAVEALRGELQRESAKQRLAEDNAVLYARLVHCCLVEGDEEAAFGYAVAGKGRAFVDMLATSRFDLSTAGVDNPRLAEDLRQARELRQQIDELLARLVGESGASPEEDGEERDTVQRTTVTELRSLQEQEAAHWEEMSYRYPALTATQQVPTLSAEEAGVLAEGLEATLVEYYLHAGGWCAFVVTPDSMGHVPLPGVSDGFLERMTGWLGRIESPTGRGKLSYEPLRRLYQALIAPLHDYLPPAGRVVLAPFGHLHRLPLGAAVDPATGRYVAEDHTLTFAPNLAALRTAQQQGASSAAGQDGEEGLLSVAYPDVPDSDNHLPNVLPEAEAVARHFARVTPLYEQDATPEAVLSHARGQDVLHLGCHGNFDSESPQQSGLMLSGGWLTVQRIITELHLEKTRLATIGACLSGRVHVRQGRSMWDWCRR